MAPNRLGDADSQLHSPAGFSGKVSEQHLVFEVGVG